jgi:homeobox-leucine zipper protein
VNRKLTAMNKLLMEENERLQKQVSQLVHENAYMKQQLQNVSPGFVNQKPYRGISLEYLHASCCLLFSLLIPSLYCLQPSLATDASCESNATTPANLRDASNPSG